MSIKLVTLGLAATMLLAGMQMVGNASAPKAESKALAQGNNDFALDLYGQLCRESGNQFFSPLSISTALAMTSAGAANQTLEEMVKTLHLPQDQEALHNGYASWLESLRSAGSRNKEELAIANSLWGQSGYPFLPQFLQTTQAHYGAGLIDVNFKDPEAARLKINRWVEEQTKDKIKELFRKDVLRDDTRLVLVNAIYFKGGWMRPFIKGATRDGDFHLNGGKTIQVPMMHQTNRFAYGEGDGWQVIELPYSGRTTSMVVLLPKSADAMAEFEKNLKPEAIAKMLSSMEQQQVALTLPKFKATGEFELKEPLRALGMKQAFSDRSADFSRMCSGEPLKIDKVIHKAFVDVNEEGTEAAAATGVVMAPRGMAPRPQQPKVFHADRPFVFMIRDTATGGILFLGRLSDPKAG